LPALKRLAAVIVAAALLAAALALALQRGSLPRVEGETQVYDRPPREEP